VTKAVEGNVVALLRAVADRAPDRPALVFGDGDASSFSELWDSADAISNGLAADGLRPGDRAVVMIPMSVDLYSVLLGLLKLGAVAVFVDPWIGAKQIAAMSAFADPKAFIGIAKSHLLRLLNRRLRKIPLSVTAGGRLWRWPARRTLSELSTARREGEVHPVEPSDSALITFTSGSSGVPKGANRTHGFLAAQHRALTQEFPYVDTDVDMPMFPVFALNNLALGITSVVPQMDFKRVADVDPVRILRQMDRHAVTTCTASPPFFDRLAAHIGGNPRDRPPLRRILTGGAPVSDRQLRAWQLAFPETEILVVYGSTEAEPVAHIEASERLRATSDVRPGSPGYCVGSPTDQVRTRVIRLGVDPAAARRDLDVAPREIGELLVAGDHVSKDYFKNPKAVRENKLADADGTVWHRMGDTGYFDGDGRFWLVGRVHSTIVRGGEEVHPQLVEQAAGADDPRIRRAAAVGLADSELGQRVELVLETSAGDELRDDVRSRLRQAGQQVDEIVLLDEPLPVDPRHNSKIDYDSLRARLEGRVRG